MRYTRRLPWWKQPFSATRQFFWPSVPQRRTAGRTYLRDSARRPRSAPIARSAPTSTTNTRIRTASSRSFIRHDWTWWLSAAAIFGFVMIIIGTLSVAGLFAYYSRDLPDPNGVIRRDGFATKILDRNGEPLYDVYEEEKRIPVEYDQIPQSLIWATIAVEDKSFYEHNGFDVMGIIRGASRQFTQGRAQGGSTLTQQLVKNALLTSERSLTRKIKEFVLSVQIERKFTKEEILLMYLNEAPYGGTSYGVGAAAESLFGKNIEEINLVESAIIAGLPQSPTRYSPFGSDPDAFIARTQHVLRRMHEDDYLTDDEYQSALDQLTQVQFASDNSNFKAPHFVTYVREILSERYGEEVITNGGLRVTTTLDWDLQQKAQTAISEEIDQVIDLNITNGASVVMNPQTGEILAMVGSRDYNDPNYDGKFNASLGFRQPGSSIKPLTYVAALREGYTAATMLMDVSTEFPSGDPEDPYVPVNYNGKFAGPVLLREALGNSLNIPAVKLLALVGLRDMMSLGYEMGLTTLEPTAENMSRLGLSVTLGGGEVRLIDLVSAYSAFANGGHRVEPVSILKVEDKDGRILEEVTPDYGVSVLTEEEAWIISNILSDNNARAQTFGTRNSLQIPGHTVAVKTGTTNQKRDNWTIGWTPSYIVGVWVGNNDNSEMKQVASGVTGAAPIWRRIILDALENQSAEEFERPAGITEMEVDTISGYAAHDGFPSKLEYFISGTEPTAEDPIHTKLKVCRGDNSKLANEILISNNDYDEVEYFVFKEDDPLQKANEPNKWQAGIDAWLASTDFQGDSRYNPPTEYCDGGGGITIHMIDPGNETTFDTNEIKLKANPVSGNPIQYVEFYVDDVLISTLNSRPYEDTVNLDDGPHTIRAKTRDEQGKEADTYVKIGVNVPWDTPSDTPTPEPKETTTTGSPSPTATPTP